MYNQKMRLPSTPIVLLLLAVPFAMGDDCYLHLERDGTPCDDHNGDS
jgi:hypothetical protein